MVSPEDALLGGVMRLSEGTSDTLLRESSGAGRCVLGSLEAAGAVQAAGHSSVCCTARRCQNEFESKKKELPRPDKEEKRCLSSAGALTTRVLVSQGSRALAPTLLSRTQCQLDAHRYPASKTKDEYSIKKLFAEGLRLFP